MANLSMHFMKHICSRFMYNQFKHTFSPCVLTRRNFSCTFTVFNNQRKYGDKHEWVSLEGKIGTVGITNYAQESLGEVVYVQLPDIGTHCKADDHCGVIESVKAVNELCSPVSGRVSEVNEILEDKPGLINESCYSEGWIFKIELFDTTEMDKLMNEKEYEDYLKSME